ncbi:MAG TPA: ABC transporter ATP-binding protein [Candidatus Dormibacteraeota bacterium]|nr:ABC transporter ATP-binding protein [Candidatus Dormibacteraeota bacterium]
MREESAGNGSNALSASGLFKIYREGATETVALRGANLEVHRSEFVSLVGPSGSGKSTLLSILGGLVLPSAGSVLMDGRDITRLDEAERAQVRAANLGIVFQKGNLVPFLSALENVELAMRIHGRKPGDGARARALLTELGLEDRMHHHPRRLSGGEAQRVAIAVALANQPAVLLGDEVTGELDSTTSEVALELLLRIQRERGLAMLLVTHNPDLAARADRRLAIVDGLIEDRP